jgi:hypothetical protein
MRNIQSQRVVITMRNLSNCSKFPGWFRFCFTRNRLITMSLPTRKTRTVGNSPVSPHNNCHFRCTMLAPIQYRWSDCIMTWWILRFCSSSCAFTSSCQMWNQTNVQWVAIESQQIWHSISCYFSHSDSFSPIAIWQHEVEVQAKTTQPTYWPCQDTIKTRILIWGESGINCLMELVFGFNPSKNPQV